MRDMIRVIAMIVLAVSPKSIEGVQSAGNMETLAFSLKMPRPVVYLV
ncbi:MAG: hypothetical protein VYE44_05595 [Verrucomicrobiota bacterium]|nr:hypothetical protein [Verrucomicrobiota bacterium]